MKIAVTETNQIRTVTLRLWRGGVRSGFEPDCSNDVLDGGTLKHDVDGNCLMTEDEYDCLVRFAEEEIKAANEGVDGEVLMGLTEDEYDNGDEWVFDCD